MDRNVQPARHSSTAASSLSARRAWIEILLVYLALIRYLSLSARRAWIEIIDDLEPSRTRKVALRKESVDRNYAKEAPPHITQRSLSARRAWIEIILSR